MAFYFATVALLGLFILLPGVAGAWLSIHLGRHLDRRSFQIALVSAVVSLVVLAALWWRAEPAANNVLETRVLEVLDQLLVKTRFAQYPFLPSYWLSSSVLQWADDALSAAMFFMLVLLSHAAFFGFLAFTRLGNSFYDAASAVQSRASVWTNWKSFRADRSPGAASPAAAGPVERWVHRLGWMGRDVRALLIKDARMFWRDTAQWGQCVMLFGLLGMYIINLRHFTHHLASAFWINLVAYLNLGACALNLATLTTRFVFPQFSLEGRRLWIIGLAPLGLARVVKAKYWLASSASLVVTLGLITLSCGLLKMRWDQIAFFGAVVTVMTFSLNGLAVGLGVLYPNLKEANPSKIVSGFGGTLCLALSFLYILGSVLLLAFGTGGWHAHTPWMIASIFVFALLSLLIGWVPLKLGLRQLKRFEF